MAGRRAKLVAKFATVMVATFLLYLIVIFAVVYQASRWSDETPVDAIVVMGAAQYDGVPSPALKGRLDRAFELYGDGVADMLVVTGGGQEGDRTTEAKSGYDYLRSRGVADEALRLEVDGKNSWETLRAVARFLEPEDKTDVVIVSDPYHSRRVLDIADEVGLRANVAPTVGSSSADSLLRETAAVALGRLVGFRRL